MRILSCCLLVSLIVNGQRYLGLNTSNYSGALTIQESPASFVHQKLKWDVHIVGFGVSANTQIGYLANESLLSYASKKQTFDASDSIPSRYNSATDALYYMEDVKSPFDAFMLNIQLFAPSVAIRVGDFSFGLFSKARVYGSALDIPEFFNFYQLKELQNYKNYTIPKFETNAMAWAEIGLHFGKKFEVASERSFSIGANVKYLMGYEALNIANRSEFKFYRTNDSIYASNINVQSAIATGMDYNSKKYTPAINGRGFGFDLGMEYAIVKELEEPETFETKFRAHFTLKDIGYIHFDKNAQVHEFLTSQPIDIYKKYNSGSQTLNDFIRRSSNEVFGDSLQTLKSTSFDQYLPMSLNIGADINIWKGCYVNAQISRRLQFFERQVAAPNVWSVVPRYETKWLEGGVPIVLVDDSWLGVGAYVRLGLLTIGTDHLNSILFSQEKLRGADIYMALKWMPFGNGGRFDDTGSFAPKGKKKDYDCYSVF